MGKLRHWKQRFDKDAAFVWRKSILYGKGYTKIGGKIPKELAADRNRLRRFWESGVIELKEFKEPQDILRPTKVDDVTPEGQEGDVTPEGQEGDVPKEQEGVQEDAEVEDGKPVASVKRTRKNKELN